MKFTEGVTRDILALMLGARLGSGIARSVYVFRPNPTLVVKIEEDAGSFQNIIEWTTWNEVSDTKWAVWFAPCHHISPCGTALIQSRTHPLGTPPDKIPNFFADLKPENWGMLDGRPVAHDYGYTCLSSMGLARARLSKRRSENLRPYFTT